MSSAICLIYLVTEYSWALILVSAFSQPCREPAAAAAALAAAAAAASTLVKQGWSLDMQLHPTPCLPTDPPSRHICVCVQIRLVIFRPQIWQVFPIPICVALGVCVCVGGESVKAPCEEGRRAGITPVLCSHAHLLPLTPPGMRSDLCRDLAPLFTRAHAFPLRSEETAPNSMCITRAFSGRPPPTGRGSASSRLPWLLFGSGGELRCGVRLT